MVLPSDVVETLLLTEPPPEWTVTPFGPVVVPLTPPGPAVTLLPMLPDVLRSFILPSTTLQLRFGVDDELELVAPPDEDDELEELLDVCACAPAASASANAIAPIADVLMALSQKRGRAGRLNRPALPRSVTDPSPCAC